MLKKKFFRIQDHDLKMKSFSFWCLKTSRSWLNLHNLLEIEIRIRSARVGVKGGFYKACNEKYTDGKGETECGCREILTLNSVHSGRAPVSGGSNRRAIYPL